MNKHIAEQLKPQIRCFFKGGGYYSRWKTEQELERQQADIDSRPTFNDFDQTDKVTIDGGNIKAGTISSKNNFSKISLDDGTFSFGNGALSWSNNTLTIGGNNNLKTEIDKKATPEDVQNAIDSIEVGGRNLLTHIDENWERGIYASASGAKTSGNTRLRLKNPIPVTSEQKYHISSFKDSFVVIYTFHDENMTYITGQSWTSLPVIVSSPVGASFMTISVRATPDAGIGSTDEFRIMVENGTKGTDWTPAPEDIESSISDVDEKATDAKNKTDAWSYEGTTEINGTSIKTGTFEANKITTGRLKSQNDISWLNLNNGEFNFANGGLVYSAGNLTLKGKLNVTNLEGKLTDSQITNAGTWNAKETTTGAQTKANTAEKRAKDYAGKTFRAYGIGYLNRADAGIPFTSGRIIDENGKNITTGLDRNYLLAVIDRNDNVSFQKTYDVYTNETEAKELADKLNSLDKRHLVILVGSHAPGVGRTLSGLPQAIYKCGGTPEVFIDEDWEAGHPAYLLVGRGGIGEGNGFESFSSRIDGAMIDVNIPVKNGTTPLVSESDIVRKKASDAKTKTDAWTWGNTTEIDGGAIRTKTIEAEHIKANSLSSLSANLGEVTAGTIRSIDNAVNINLNTGTINLSRPLTVNHLPVSTKKEVEDAIQNIEIGGRNLVVASTVTDGHYVTPDSTVKPSGVGANTTDFIKVFPNTAYVFSNADSGPTQTYMGFYDINKNPIRERRAFGTSSTAVFKTEDEECIRISNPNIRQLKLEKGNKATDWTPAPEDVNKRLDEVEGNINNAVTTIDNTGVTVKDGSFFLEDDTSDTKYSLQVKRNMINYHSFEAVKSFGIPYADYTSSTRNHDDPNNTSISGGWHRVNEPRITSGGATYNNQKVGIFGKSMLVNNVNYIFLMLSASQAELYPMGQLTFSFHSKKPVMSVAGQPRIEIDIVDANNTVVTSILKRNYPVATEKVKRHSATFSIPGAYDEQSHLLRIRILSANSNEIVVDGVQLVDGPNPVQYNPATEVWNLREALGMNSYNLRGDSGYWGISPGLVHTHQISVPNNRDGRVLNFMLSDGESTYMWADEATVNRKLTLYGDMDISGSVNGNLETYKNTGKVYSSINATNNSSNNWNNKANSSLKLRNNNNALSFIVGGTQNNRHSIIQGGHSEAGFASFLSALHLNRLGGTVYVGSGLSVSGSKNAIHVTRDGLRATPAYEMAESYLGDMGEDKTGLNSKIKIMIDTLFFDTINTDYTYYVFLQAHSNNNVWVEEREKEYFIIASDSPEVSFSWEMKAKRRGFEKDRLVRDDEITYEDIQTMQEYTGAPDEDEEVKV